MKVLVTGANGFVGAALCKKLVLRGDEVRGVVRKTSDLSLLKGVRVQKVIGSLNDRNSLNKAVEKADVVYHVAGAVSDWGSIDYFWKGNVEGTRNLIEASVNSGVKRFVYISSIVVHSHIGSCDLNEDSPQFDTLFPYVQTKREAEKLVMSFHKDRKIEVCIIRPGDVFGPGDRVSLLKMANLLEKGRMVYIGGGKSTGAFTFVENLADGLILAGTRKEAAGEVFVITDGYKVTWKKYFETLTGVLGLPSPKISLHPAFIYALASIFEFVYGTLKIKSRPLITKYIVTHIRSDFHFKIDKARNLLGFRPKVDFFEAIQRTAQWYRKVVRNE